MSGKLYLPAIPLALITVSALRALGGGAERRAFIRRTEAVAAWTERVRDTMAGAAGLEEAIVATAPVATAANRPEGGHPGGPHRAQSLLTALAASGGEVAHPSLSGSQAPHPPVPDRQGGHPGGGQRVARRRPAAATLFWPRAT